MKQKDSDAQDYKLINIAIANLAGGCAAAVTLVVLLMVLGLFGRSWGLDRFTSPNDYLTPAIFIIVGTVMIGTSNYVRIHLNENAADTEESNREEVDRQHD